MKRAPVEQRRTSAWPALRTLGNCVALPLAITLALAAARKDRSTFAMDGGAADAVSLPVELERIGDAPTSERPLPPALVDNLSRWIEPVDPVKIPGPIYYVGTHGLAAYLITTPAGHILVDGGMPSSAKAIEASIRKLGFKPEEIRFLLITHAHIDHAGTLAYFKRMSDATVAVMARDFDTLKSGGRTDPIYAAEPAFYFPAVKADRVLKDGDTVSVGNVSMTARLTAGHTQGCTTWVMTVTDGGQGYRVVFPGSSNVNP